MSLCECGCGERPTPGCRFVQHHHCRKSPVAYAVNASGCWIWQRSRFGNGYPQAWKDKRPYPAHRLYYELHVGPIPPGLDLDHLCRTPLCVNPAHLEPVTRRVNARRGARTKLTPETVRQIREASGTIAEIAQRFGLHPSYAGRVRRGEVWADVG
jgi:hypothetical protein